MAIFQGANIDPSPNVLYDPMAARRARQDYQRNDLMMEQQRQQMRRQSDAETIEFGGRAASYVLGIQNEAERPAAYKAALAYGRATGHALDGAPEEYPGNQYLQMLVSRAIPTAEQYKMGVNRDGVNAAWPGGGAPAPGGAPVAGGAAPVAGGAAPAVAPYVPRNLPAGISPDEDATVRTVIGEAGGEGPVGQRAVAHVINNRAVASGLSPLAVTQAPGQFEPWGNAATRAKLEGIDPNSPEYQQTLGLIRNAGDDPTGGATHFYAPKLQTALGRDAPSWATGTPTVIGGHSFYKVGYQAPGSAPGGGASGGGQGVAGRTPGAVDYAGPGAPPTATVPAPGDYTPAQRQQLDAMRANPGAYTGRDIIATREKFDDDNRQAAQQAFERARQAAADTAAATERDYQHKKDTDTKARQDAKDARETAPFGGTGDAAEAKTQMRGLVGKIRDGTATQAERDDYALSAEHFLKPTMQWVEDGKGGQQLVAVPGKMPEGFPHPTFRPGAQEEPKPPPPTKRGPPLPQADRAKLIDNAARLDGLTELVSTFKPEYGGHNTAVWGDLRNAYERNTTGGPQSDWWQNYQRQKLAVRQGISGQSLTASELAEFDKADITTGMSAATIKSNLEHQQKVLQRAQGRWVESLKAGGFNEEEIAASSKPAEQAGGAGAASAAPVTVKSPEEAHALQPGTHYQTPDGRAFIR